MHAPNTTESGGWGGGERRSALLNESPFLHFAGNLFACVVTPCDFHVEVILCELLEISCLHFSVKQATHAWKPTKLGATLSFLLVLTLSLDTKRKQNAQQNNPRPAKLGLLTPLSLGSPLLH